MTVLILGWKTRFEQHLAALGEPVVVVLGNEEFAEYGDLPRSAADVIHLPSKCDVDGIIPALSRRGIGRDDVRRVFTDQEPSLVSAALLALYFGAEGPDVATMARLRDKFEQKEAVHRSGVGVARQRVVANSAGPRPAALEGFPFPAVIKPAGAWGSRHTSVVSDLAQATAVLEALPRGGADAESFLMEQCVDGIEMHADGQLVDGQLTFLSVSEYPQHVLIARRRARVSSVVLSPSCPHFEEGATLVQTCAKALDIVTGAFHVEFFRTSDGLVFSEFGARTGGTWVTDAVLVQYGVDLRRLALLGEAAGSEPVAPTPIDGTVGWGYLPVPVGRVAGLPTTAEVGVLPGIRQVRVDEGLAGTTNDSMRRGGLFVVHGSNEGEARQRISDTQDWFEEHVVLVN